MGILENVIVHLLKVVSLTHSIHVGIKANHGYDRSTQLYICIYVYIRKVRYIQDEIQVR